MTLLFWKFTGGLYYELIGTPAFANEFGEGFQDYVGEVIDQTCVAPTQRFSEAIYSVGKLEKRTVDWIVADQRSALFIECKARRLSWDAKTSLSDLRPLEADIENMAKAVVQVYRTISDYRSNLYPQFPFEKERKVYPAIVTLENWRMFGPVMMNKLAEAVSVKLESAGLSPDVVDEMPYSIFAIEELEVGLQLMNENGIADFIDGKLNSLEMRQWDWHGYMSKIYPSSFPAKRLFQDEYDEMFSPLFRKQAIGD